MTLNELHTGDSATIARIRGRGAFRKRLTEIIEKDAASPLAKAAAALLPKMPYQLKPPG